MQLIAWVRVWVWKKHSLSYMCSHAISCGLILLLLLLLLPAFSSAKQHEETKDRTAALPSMAAMQA